MSQENTSGQSTATDSHATPTSSRSPLRYLSKVGRGTKIRRFAAVTGAATLLRAVRSLRRGDRRRGTTRLLLGGLWIAFALAQRRYARSSGFGGSDVDQTDVVNTSPDIENAAADSGAEGERGIESEGEPTDAVDTTTIDIDESDTAPELESDVETEDVDQTDVVDTGTDVTERDDSQDGSTQDRDGSTQDS